MAQLNILLSTNIIQLLYNFPI